MIYDSRAQMFLQRVACLLSALAGSLLATCFDVWLVLFSPPSHPLPIWSYLWHSLLPSLDLCLQVCVHVCSFHLVLYYDLYYGSSLKACFLGAGLWTNQMFMIHTLSVNH